MQDTVAKLQDQKSLLGFSYKSAGHSIPAGGIVTKTQDIAVKCGTQWSNCRMEWTNCRILDCQSLFFISCNSCFTNPSKLAYSNLSAQANACKSCHISFKTDFSDVHPIQKTHTRQYKEHTGVANIWLRDVSNRQHTACAVQEI